MIVEGFTNEQVLDLLDKLDTIILNQATLLDNLLLLDRLLILLFAVSFITFISRLGVFRWLKR